MSRLTEKKNSQENKKKTTQQNPITRLILSGEQGLDSDLVFIPTDWIKMPHKSME